MYIRPFGVALDREMYDWSVRASLVDGYARVIRQHHAASVATPPAMKPISLLRWPIKCDGRGGGGRSSSFLGEPSGTLLF